MSMEYALPQNTAQWEYGIVYSGPNVTDHGPETWIQVTLNDML